MTLFVEQGKTRKQIAEALKVRENTVGKWAAEGNWEDLRTSRLTSAETVITDLKQLIAKLSKKRLAMEDDDDADAADKARLTDELSKQGKVLSEVKGEGDITLNARLHTLEWAFGLMRKEHPTLHNQLVDFHLELIEEAARIHA